MYDLTSSVVEVRRKSCFSFSSPRVVISDLSSLFRDAGSYISKYLYPLCFPSSVKGRDNLTDLDVDGCYKVGCGDAEWVVSSCGRL